MDCELVRAGFPSQPVNAVTALSFVVAGVLLISRRKTGPALYGLSLAGIGVTSFLLHGIGLDGSVESIAVVALATWVIVWITAATAGRGVWVWIGGTALLGATLSFFNDTRNVVTAVASAAAAVLLIRTKTPRISLGIALSVIGAGVYVLARSGGPWCDPTSLFQGHGLWHLMMATALWIIGDGLARKEMAERSDG